MKEPETHDYTLRGWGHDCAITRVIDGGKKLTACGWGEGVKKGHFLILPNGAKSTRYKVKRIEYKRDPPDMWFAELTFAPR